MKTMNRMTAIAASFALALCVMLGQTGHAQQRNEEPRPGRVQPPDVDDIIDEQAADEVDSTRKGADEVEATRQAVDESTGQVKPDVDDRLRGDVEESDDEFESEDDLDFGATLRMGGNDRMVISDVTDGGLFARAGIRRNDVILSIDGNSITTRADVARWILDADTTARIPVVVMRDGRQRTVYLNGVADWRSRNRTNMGLGLMTDSRGRIVVSSISRSSVFADSGLRRGDIIIETYGRPVESQPDFYRIVRSYSGPQIPVVVLRDGRREVVHVDVEGDRFVRRGPVRHPDDYRDFDNDQAWLGVYLDTRYANQAVVEAVQVGSAADRADLKAGDWIVRINGQRIRGPSHLSQIVRTMDPGDVIDMEVSRRVRTDMTARLGERPVNRSRFRYEDGSDIPPPVADSELRGVTRDREVRGFRRGVEVEEGGSRDDGRTILDGDLRERLRDRRGR